MTDLNQYNARRKADREAIAAELTAIGERHGAVVTRRDMPRHVGWCGAGIDLGFSLNGVGAGISIDDLHGGDHSLISWHYRGLEIGDAVPVLTPAFNSAVGNYASRPHHKATTSGTWQRLAEALDAGLALAAAGQALMARDGVS